LSVEEPQKIDIVATRPGSREVRLVITDHLSWSDEEAHLLLLQQKLNTYIAFVESGQVLKVNTPKVPPDAQITVVVAAQYAPTETARVFFQQVSVVLSDLGVSFTFELRGG
jgi:hypothetical protein